MQKKGVMKMISDKEFQSFKDEVDLWIKDLKKEISKFIDYSNHVEENIGSIQHNFELIHELKDEIEKLKQEINALKVIQIINLKKRS